MKPKTMRIIRIVLWSAIIITMILAICSCRQDLPEFYEDVNPAVVWIGAEIGPDDYEYYDCQWEGASIKWQGTGFIISSDGLIATAGHVVEDTETFQLRFSDGRKGKARFAYKENSKYCDAGFIQITWIQRKGRLHILEWINPKIIINLIWDGEIPPEPIRGLPYVKFANEVKIAEELIIVGYPWGLQRGSTITQGIVSALNRDISFFGEKFMIHTDTASWPGNSGSAVFNMNGDVVGILVGGAWGCDNYSLVTPAKLVKLALDKYKAERAMKEAK
jgi:serine protease Do